MNWHFKSFDALTLTELYSILRLRSEVFIVEQDCVCLDPDGADPACLHLWAEEGGEIAAYCRIIPPGVTYDEAALGRIITAPALRGIGLGRELVLRAAEHARGLGHPSLRISAQTRAQGFYDGLGFVPITGIPYMEEGLLHVAMRKLL